MLARGGRSPHRVEVKNRTHPALHRVRGPACDLEAKVDIDGPNVKSFAIPQAEMARHCKHPSAKGICPELQPAITKLLNSFQ